MGGSKDTARAKPGRARGEKEALALCQKAVTRTLHVAAEALLGADNDLIRAMEPIDKALKLRRELSKEAQDAGGVTVVVETLVDGPGGESE